MGDEGEVKQWTYEQLKGGDTFLSQFAANNRYETQHGMTGMGMPRLNITKDKKLGFIDPDMKGNEVHRPQMGTNQYDSQKGMTCIGAIRNQVPYPKFKEGDEFHGHSQEGETILPKQCGDFGFATMQGKQGEDSVLSYSQSQSQSSPTLFLCRSSSGRSATRSPTSSASSPRRRTPPTSSPSRSLHLSSPPLPFPPPPQRPLP